MIDAAEYQTLWQWGRDYIHTHCIERRDQAHRMPGKRPGTWYTWIFMLRRGLYNPQFLKAVSQMFEYRIAQELGHKDFQVAGRESAAAPLLVGLATWAGVNAISVRKEQKDCGLQQWVEGVPNSLPVMIVDDLCSSSGSYASRS